MFKIRYLTEKGKTERSLNGIRAIDGYFKLLEVVNNYVDVEPGPRKDPGFSRFNYGSLTCYSLKNCSTPTGESLG